MQYFKHMANMRHDRRIKKLINRFGIEGYGLYCLILELIVDELTTESPDPELLESCDDLAEFYNGNSAKIDEMVRYMISNNLLEVNEINKRVTCSKIYKYLEKSITRSESIRKMIESYKNVYNVRDKSGQPATNLIEQEQEQEPEIEQEYIDFQSTGNTPKRKRFVIPTADEVSQYMKEIGMPNHEKMAFRFIAYYESKGWKVGKSPMVSWKAACQTWKNNNSEYTGTNGSPKKSQYEEI